MHAQIRIPEGQFIWQPANIVMPHALFVFARPWSQKGAFMKWETPDYREINMSAEIGGYQDDFDERAPKPGDPMRMGDAPQSVVKEA